MTMCVHDLLLLNCSACQRDTAQFTPGPWTTGVWEGAVSGAGQHYGKHAAVFAPSGDMVCPCGLPDDPENIPNARLIAAAPELYEALRELLTAVRYADPPRDFGTPDEPNLCHEARIPTDFVTIAERALAKAAPTQRKV